MDGLDGVPYSWLTKEHIAKIEEEFNPAHIAFPPPKSWSCPQIDMALKKAYREKFPNAPLEPDYERAKNYLTGELNRILERRLLDPVANSIEAWKSEKFPGNAPFSSVALVGANCTVKGGFPSPAATQSSPEATLPLKSECAPSILSTSVSTGRGTSTVNGNGEPSGHRSEPSGPSPRRTSSHSSPRPRRGRGNRVNQSRAGAHLCPAAGCGKTFQYPSKLRDHAHTHLAAKDFSCNLGKCTKSFKRLRELKAHEKTHPGYIPGSESGDQDNGENEDHVMVDAGQEMGQNENVIESEVREASPSGSSAGLKNNPDERASSPSPSTPADRGIPSPPASPRHIPTTIIVPSASLPVMSSATSPGLGPDTQTPGPSSERARDLEGEELVNKIASLAERILLDSNH